uniref:Solute carrier family 15 member 2 n=1 Tax=Tetraodon nigroviridis TaxID=99883 RepID=H3DE35_TETNG
KLCGTNYPTSICFIVVNEFCERFSYYGMKAVLTFYFISYLRWDADLSTAIYHAFSSLCYFTPILGAIIADSWLGKFKTIIYLSLIYVMGHVIKSVGAIPTVGNKDAHISLSMVGLVLIAFGTGGIKPCVSAFGGDQFDEDNLRERQKFFSIFYMSINAGSLLSTVITPILRSDVQCFGGDCYALAFGVPAALMVVALVVFIAGSGLYKRNPPQGNVMLRVCKCIGFAIKNRWQRSKHDPDRKHWLDWAEEKYSKRLIQEIKMVLRVLVLFIPLPMFWALFDQQGSRWTIQAARMNMAFGDAFSIKPDHMQQMLNAMLILIFVPIFDLIIYPLVGLCGVKVTPLRKMAAGMVLAALAFGAATLVEVNVVKTVVDPAPAEHCHLQVFNLAPGDVSVAIRGSDLFAHPIPSLQDPPEYQVVGLKASSRKLQIEATFQGRTSACEPLVQERKAYSLLLVPEGEDLRCKLVEDFLKKNETGVPLLRFFNALPEAVNLTVGDVVFSAGAGEMSPNQTVERQRYSSVSCSRASKPCPPLDLDVLEFGASYTVILTEQEDGSIVPYKMEDVKANNVHIAFQIPQYALMTAGEVMFSITGLEFSYSQAPANMKSVLQAGWLLTVAFGNVIVLIVAEGAGLEQQWVEFLLFACMLLGVCIVFSIMAHFYTYVDPDQVGQLSEDDDEDAKKTPADLVLKETST